MTDDKNYGKKPWNKDKKPYGDRKPWDKDKKRYGDGKPWDKDKKQFGNGKPRNKDKKSFGDGKYRDKDDAPQTADGSEPTKEPVKKVMLRQDLINGASAANKPATEQNELTGIAKNILFEDNHILVVIKPQNLPTQGDKTGDKSLVDELKEYLIKKYDKPGDAYLGLVHRLDRPTGGIMVFAKTSKAAARLSEQIREGDFDKCYAAVTSGKPNRFGRVEHYLIKDERTNVVSLAPSSLEGAKLAVGEVTLIDETYETEPESPTAKKFAFGDKAEDTSDTDVADATAATDGSADENAVAVEAVSDENIDAATNEKKFEKMSLVSVKLLTGRTHQVRVQLKALGAPIVGDGKYAGDKLIRSPHLALWAYKLCFTHPVSGDIMLFFSQPPQEFPWTEFDTDTLVDMARPKQ